MQPVQLYTVYIPNTNLLLFIIIDGYISSLLWGERWDLGYLNNEENIYITKWYVLVFSKLAVWAFWVLLITYRNLWTRVPSSVHLPPALEALYAVYFLNLVPTIENYGGCDIIHMLSCWSWIVKTQGWRSPNCDLGGRMQLFAWPYPAFGASPIDIRHYFANWHQQWDAISPTNTNNAALFLPLIPNVAMFTPTDARRISTPTGQSLAPLKSEGH